MSITVSLVRIERWLHEQSPHTVASLQPPATLDVLDAAARTLGAPLPPDLKRLYLWHNGAATTGHRFEITPSYFFLPLTAALDAWSYRNTLYAGHLAHDPDFRDWQTHWLPIATDECGDYVVAETHHPGRVFISDAENGAMTEHAWPSLPAWADNMLAALTTDQPLAGHWRPDPDSPTLRWRPAEP